jgi:hypothetical protein
MLCKCQSHGSVSIAGLAMWRIWAKNVAALAVSHGFVVAGWLEVA